MSRELLVLLSLGAPLFFVLYYVACTYNDQCSVIAVVVDLQKLLFCSICM